MTAAVGIEDAGTRVPFNDLTIQWRAIADDVRRDFEEVFQRSAFCLGPYVEAFEKEVATWLCAKHAIGVNSGTSALHLAVLGAGLGPGDEVLIPAQTFIATIWGVIYSGARPVLCDVDEATGTIDLTDAAKRVTSRSRAIIPVHLFGQPANMDAVAKFAEANELAIIEDNAQAFGARWNGRMLGSIGNSGCISFYPGKNLGAAGEAGLVITQDEVLADRLRSLRNHGQSVRYIHQEVGYNYRMDGLQAVVLRHKLKLIDVWTEERRRHAANYSQALAGLPLELPKIAHQDHVWHLYVVRSPRRDELKLYLQTKNIETGLHYPVPMSRQPCMSTYVEAHERYPVAERWASQGLSLPLFVGMTNTQQAHVINAIQEFFRR